MYGIVREAGGDTRSIPSRASGTTVTVTLPSPDGDAAALRRNASRGTAAGLRCLIAEDEEPLVGRRQDLRDAGFDVIEAADGEAALESGERQY